MDTSPLSVRDVVDLEDSCDIEVLDLKNKGFEYTVRYIHYRNGYQRNECTVSNILKDLN